MRWMRSLRWDLGLLPTEAEIFISYKIVIELDGSQHGEPENREADTIRDKSLGEYGMRVLRYTNKQIKQNKTLTLMELTFPVEGDRHKQNKMYIT